MFTGSSGGIPELLAEMDVADWVGATPPFPLQDVKAVRLQIRTAARNDDLNFLVLCFTTTTLIGLPIHI